MISSSTLHRRYGGSVNDVRTLHIVHGDRKIAYPVVFDDTEELVLRHVVDFAIDDGGFIGLSDVPSLEKTFIFIYGC